MFNSANSQSFFVKISGIDSWLSRINWCEGLNLFGRQAVRHNHKNCIFTSFLRIRQTAWRPYKLSLVAALCINLSYQHKDQSLNFSGKNVENWRSWKSQFFWVGHFESFFQKNNIFLGFIPIQISRNLWDTKAGTKMLWLVPWFSEKTRGGIELWTALYLLKWIWIYFLLHWTCNILLQALYS